MRFAHEGQPFIIGALTLFTVASVVAHLLHQRPLGLIFIALGLVGAAFMMFFFRDPERTVPEGEGLFVSGADGIVNSIEVMREDVFLKCDAVRITVFLNLHDVHINRTPMAGAVELVTYTPGKFLEAWKENASFENGRSTIGIRGEKTNCLIRQIVGLVARRVVTNVNEGETLAKGQRIGLMKFGSRLDVFFPVADVEVTVKKGQRVRAGETIIARLRQ